MTPNYAKGIGCVKELPAEGELALKSHTSG